VYLIFDVLIFTSRLFFRFKGVESLRWQDQQLLQEQITLKQNVQTQSLDSSKKRKLEDNQEFNNTNAQKKQKTQSSQKEKETTTTTTTTNNNNNNNKNNNNGDEIKRALQEENNALWEIKDNLKNVDINDLKYEYISVYNPYIYFHYPNLLHNKEENYTDFLCFLTLFSHRYMLQLNNQPTTGGYQRIIDRCADGNLCMLSRFQIRFIYFLIIYSLISIIYLFICSLTHTIL
jgi:hypothetical protein